MLQKISIAFTVFSVFLTKLSEDFFRNSIDACRKYDLKDKDLFFMGYCFTYEGFDDIIVENLIGKGTGGIVFSAKRIDKKVTETIQDEELIVKINYEEDESYEDCNEIYEIQQELKNSESGKYIIGMEKPIQFFVPATRFNIDLTEGSSEMHLSIPTYVCVIKMEKGTPANKPFFKDRNLIKNTEQMIIFMVKLLEAFKTLNFDMRYYHGDVKPENLLYVINQSTGEYEPKLIDFDLTFNRDKQTENPEYILYTVNYRSPELRDIVPGIGFNPDPQKAAEEIAEYDKYRFNEEFKEEAYAVGKTILRILANNKFFLNQEDKNLKAIENIARNMILSRLNQRISTKTAYERSLELIVHHCLI